MNKVIREVTNRKKATDISNNVLTYKELLYKELLSAEGGQKWCWVMPHTHTPKKEMKIFKCTHEKNHPYLTLSLGHLTHTHGTSNTYSTNR